MKRARSARGENFAFLHAFAKKSVPTVSGRRSDIPGGVRCPGQIFLVRPEYILVRELVGCEPSARPTNVEV